jgi:hypothetical protein
VGKPITGHGINLDVAGEGEVVTHLHDGSMEVRAGFVVPKTGVQHAQSLSVDGAQTVTMNPLVLPDGLQKSLWWGPGRGIAQDIGDPAGAPLGIKNWAWRIHFRCVVGIFLPDWRSPLHDGGRVFMTVKKESVAGAKTSTAQWW